MQTTRQTLKTWRLQRRWQVLGATPQGVEPALGCGPDSNDRGLERALIARLQSALAASGLWDELATDWVLLDCELMPWSAKATPGLFAAWNRMEMGGLQELPDEILEWTLPAIPSPPLLEARSFGSTERFGGHLLGFRF